MRLDVIMPVYNRARYLGAAINSLLRQQGDFDLQVVVVDDGSTDETPELVSALAKESGRVRCIRHENRGVTVARNTGLRNLRPNAELVGFLDSDDISVDGFIADSVGRLRTEKSLKIVYGLMTLADKIDESAFAPAAGSTVVTVRGVSLSAGIFRRDVMDATGGFDETFRQSEDLDLLFRIFERNPTMHKSGRVAMIYRRHAGNMTLEHKAALKDMLRAVHNSVKRRKADPTLISCEGIFDFTAMKDRNLRQFQTVRSH